MSYFFSSSYTVSWTFLFIYVTSSAEPAESLWELDPDCPLFFWEEAREFLLLVLYSSINFFSSRSCSSWSSLGSWSSPLVSSPSGLNLCLKTASLATNSSNTYFLIKGEESRGFSSSKTSIRRWDRSPPSKRSLLFFGVLCKDAAPYYVS